MVAAIVTDKLTKHYGAVRALEDLDLEILEGEVFGYLGPNGAGKTTTIRLLMDLIRPTSGTATVLGLDSRTDSIEIRRQVSYLPGDLSMYENLTGRELLGYFGNLRGGLDWAWVGELAERFDANLARKVGEYSSGNRQKLGILQAFMSRPRLYILDEPSTGLDPLVQQEFQALVREVAAEGSTVFLSSHTLSEVERVADRVGIIREGRMAIVERVESLKQRAIRRIDIRCAHDLPDGAFDGVLGVQSAEVEGPVARLTFEGTVEGILARATQYEVVNLATLEADLEEIFLAYYHGNT